MKRLTILLITACYLPLVSAQQCTIETRSARADAAFEDRMLDTIPSMVDSCALGPVMGGGSGSSLPWIDIDIPNEDFFCGFGAQDAWDVGSKEMLPEEMQSLEGYVNRVYRHMRDADSDQTIPIPGTSSNLPSSKVFSSVFRRIDPID